MIDADYIKEEILNGNNDLNEKYVIYNSNKYIISDLYKKIEYLESTGNQYIDMGFIPNENTSIILDFMPLETVGSAFIGVVESDSSRKFRLFNYSSRVYYDVNGRIIGSNLNANTRVTLGLYNYYVEKNGKKILQGTRVNNLGLSNPIYIFANNSVELRKVEYTRMKLYYLKVYENDDLILDFIPVLDYKNTPCLYDRVDEKFYYNQGTGEFLYG